MTTSSDSPLFDPFAGPAIADIVLTTSPQREIWTASVLGVDASLSYNESVTLYLDGPLAPTAFREALDELVARHEALRATISPDGLSVLISAPEPAKLELYDWSEHPTAQKEEKLRSLCETAVKTPFQLESGPLFRASLVRLEEEKHALVFTAHHIVCDGWSTAVVLQDWAQQYNARKHGFSPEVAPAPTLRAYGAHLDAVATETGAADERFWLEQFSGESPILDLPSEKARPARKSYPSLREDTVLDAELITAVKRSAAKSKASLFASLLAAFGTLIHRLSGQSDLVVGIPVAGQSGSDFTGLVGHCVNMLPIRMRPVPAAPFSEFLGDVRKTVLDAQEHQHLSFGALLAKLPLPRDPSRLPLVSVIFNLDRGLTSDALGFDGLSARLVTNPRRYENFDLFLNASELDGRVHLECQYNTDLFDGERIRNWLDAYRQLLETIAREPRTALGALPMLTEKDRARLALWNGTEAIFARELTVDQLVTKLAKEFPERVACEAGAVNLTYGELEARATELAKKLARLGVRRGQYVGLCLERNESLLVAALGIWKSGAAYVPLDPDYPIERLSYMVADSAMHALVTTGKLRQELSLEAPNVLCLDEDSGLADAGEAAVDAPQPEDVAYVIYTSGSTGKPKGVRVPHRAVNNLLSSVQKAPGLRKDDIVLAITTLSFDIAVSEIWLPLVTGAKIVLATREIAADGALLRDVVEKNGITFIDATPASYRLLLGAGWLPNARQTLICTGEAMPLDLARLLLPHCGALWNGYGPTETTVWSTFWRVPSGFNRVLIGRPVDNTKIYVLDEARQPVPVGVTGELFISGSGVSHGYLGRPDLTEERFLADPFEPGEKMYRTGDLGRYLADGNLECLGRNDHQVKLRGFRIELGEIEDRLTMHPNVAQATVLLREDRAGDPKLVGYLVPEGEAPTPAVLRAHLKATLPDYMLPATYVVLTRMPLTPSGKIDRKALPPPSDVPTETADFVAPATATEQILAELWASQLGLGRVSVTDDFFSLGGHSLLASQILGRLRRDHGIELPFRKFFQAPTIRELATLIDSSSTGETEKPALIVRRTTSGPLPLSLSQERLLLLEEMHPAQRVVHNLPAAWELSGPIDLGVLEKSINWLAIRHETLRTTFAREGAKLLQRVAPSIALSIETVDLRGVPDAERRERMMAQIHERSATPFELETGPLFRSTLFRLGEESYVYYTLRHNLIWDGWSFDIFITELCAVYSAMIAGNEPQIAPLPVSYGDYVLWHQERLRSPALEAQKNWWQNELKDAPTELNWPADFARDTKATYRGANAFVTLNAAERTLLTKAAHRENTTLFMVLFAAYTALLERLTGQSDLLIGLPVRGRSLPEVENIIGPFINAIVLRTKVANADSFTEHLRAVKDRALEAFSHEEMPLEMFGAKPPIVRGLFSFQDARGRASKLGSALVTQVDVEPPAAANDLMVWVMEREDKLVVVANYSTDLFAPNTIERLLRSYVHLLREVAENPSQTLRSLSVVAPGDEPQRLSGPKNSTQRQHPLEIFRNAAASRAQEIFLQSGELRLTFESAYQRVSSLGASLRKAGVTRDSIVGISVASAVETALLLLASYGVGAAVVPLPPGAPDALIAKLLRAAGATHLVAEGQPDLAISGLSVLPLPSLTEEALSSEFCLDERVRLGARFSFGAEGTAEVRFVSSRELVQTANGLLERVSLKSAGLLEADLAAEPEGALLEVLFALVSGRTVVVPETYRSLGFPRAHSEDAFLMGTASSFEALLEDGGVVGSGVVLGEADAALLEELGNHEGESFHFAVGPKGLDVPFLTRLAPRALPRLGKLLSEEFSLQILENSGAVAPDGVFGKVSRVQANGEIRDTGHRGRIVSGSELLLETRETPWLKAELSAVHKDALSRVLSSHSAILEAHSELEISDSASPRLVLYFAPRPGASFTESELRQHLRGEFPEVLMPRALVEMERLPRGAGGEVLSSELRSPFTRTGVEYVEARTSSEKLLVQAFEEVLEKTRVSVHDNFFDLGGHSLLCLRVVELLASRHQVLVSPRVLLLNTVAQAAAEIDRVRAVLSDGKPSESPKAEGLTKKVFDGLKGFLRGK